MLAIDLVDRSSALILHRPIAERSPEQCFAVVALARDGVDRQALLELVLVVSSLLGRRVEAVESLLLFDLLVLDELVQSRLADRDYVVKDVPEDALGESGRRQRTLVGPPALIV